MVSKKIVDVTGDTNGAIFQNLIFEDNVACQQLVVNICLKNKYQEAKMPFLNKKIIYTSLCATRANYKICQL